MKSLQYIENSGSSCFGFKLSAILPILFYIFSLYSVQAQHELELKPEGLIFPRTDSLGVAGIAGLVIYDTLTSQLIYFDGSAWNPVGGAFERMGNLVRPQTGFGHDDFIFGRDQLPQNGELVQGSMFFFDESNYAFRGGFVNSPDWSPDSIGVGSFAFGGLTKARGAYSFAVGLRSNTVGFGAIAIGKDCYAESDLGASAIGDGSTALGHYGNTSIGYNNLTNGNYASTAVGSLSEASGDYGSTAIGYDNEAIGDFGSTAMGFENEAIGDYGSTAIGYNTEASGDTGATAIGYRTEAIGKLGATALGYATLAVGIQGSTALGASSVASGDQGSTALGSQTIANGDVGSTAMGYGSSASGDYGSTALGDQTTSTGNYGAVAMGHFSGTSGDYGAVSLGYNNGALGSFGSIALGNTTSVLGDHGSAALGYLSKATGDFGAVAIGMGAAAHGNSCTVVGTYNDTIVAANRPLDSLSPIFIIGNGDAGAGNESNALVVRKDGNISIGGGNPTVRLKVGNNGDGTIARANSWDTFSDRRFKQKINKVSQPLQMLQQLQGRRFVWKETGKRDIGFIAQEVEMVLPELVSTDAEGYKSLDYSKVVPILVEAIKELQQEIELLKKD